MTGDYWAGGMIRSSLHAWAPVALARSAESCRDRDLSSRLLHLPLHHHPHTMIFPSTTGNAPAVKAQSSRDALFSLDSPNARVLRV